MKFLKSKLLNKHTINLIIMLLTYAKIILITKTKGIDLVIHNLRKMNFEEKPLEIVSIKEEKINKEDNEMKGFFKVLSLVSLAALAGAVVYIYNKNKQIKQMEDYLYDEHFEADYYEGDEVLNETDCDITQPPQE